VADARRRSVTSTGPIDTSPPWVSKLLVVTAVAGSARSNILVAATLEGTLAGEKQSDEVLLPAMKGMPSLKSIDSRGLPNISRSLRRSLLSFTLVIGFRYTSTTTHTILNSNVPTVLSSLRALYSDISSFFFVSFGPSWWSQLCYVQYAVIDPWRILSRGRGHMQLSQKFIGTKNMNECHQTTVPALEAIRGHRSAWIRVSRGNNGIKCVNTYAFFCHRTSNSRTLHLTLWVHNHTGVILKVEENTVLSPPRFSLPHNDGGHRCIAHRRQNHSRKDGQAIRTLLSQLGLSLLHRRNNHITNTSVGQPVEVRSESKRLNNEEGLGAAVVSAVQDCTDWQTKGHAEFVAGSSCACKRPNLTAVMLHPVT